MYEGPAHSGPQTSVFCASGAHAPFIRCAPVLKFHRFLSTLNGILTHPHSVEGNSLILSPAGFLIRKQRL